MRHIVAIVVALFMALAGTPAILAAFHQHLTLPFLLAETLVISVVSYIVVLLIAKLFNR